MITETPTVVPLIERLRRIPKKHKVSIAFQWAEDGTATGYSSIPVGYLMHTAADELAKLREELAEAKVCISNQESMLNGKNEYVGQDFKMRMQKLTQRAEQSEARALEYKTEHAALLGTSQWQETEIADLRDDVKRHMQIASECEERALANEKDAGRFRWLLEDHEHPATRELRNSLLNRMQVMSYSAACTDIDAAIGAKHD